MAGYDCVITILSDGRVIVKQFEKAMNPKTNRRAKREEDTELAEAPLSIEKALMKEVIKQKNCADGSSGKRRSRELYSGEIERFCNLVDTNFSVGHLFLTLTYEKQHVTLSEAGVQFENWIKRMRDRCNEEFRYIAIRSFQERSTLHFHVLSDLPRIPKQQLLDGSFRAIWGHGTVDVRKIYTLPTGFYKGRLKHYLIDNLKEFKRDERSFNKRLYLTSNNIVTPRVIRCNAKDFEELKALAGEKVLPLQTDSYHSTFLGKVAVTPYKISSEFHSALLNHFKL